MMPRVAIATVSLLVGACGAAEAPAPTPLTTVATPGPASPSSASVPVHRAKLEVVRVDDTIDAFATVPDESLPHGQGASIHSEYAPVGPGKNVKTTFLRVVSRDAERTTATLARIRPWLATVRLPAGARFGFADVVEEDPDTRKATPVGIRTFVLVGDSVLGTDDVTDANAKLESIGEGPPMAYVAVTLSPASSTRFEDATREWTSRRLAIVIDDVIQSAPVIRTAIAGGRISITLAVGEPDERLAEARRLARALGGR